MVHRRPDTHGLLTWLVTAFGKLYNATGETCRVSVLFAFGYYHARSRLARTRRLLECVLNHSDGVVGLHRLEVPGRK